MTNVGAWLRTAQQELERADVSTARLDALVLLEDTLKIGRARLLAHPEHVISTKQATILKRLIDRRASHEPLAYIRQKTEFYGREFYIDHRVLEPRPESETMIDLLKQTVMHRVGPGASHTVQEVVDVGTGSGALAVTTKLETPQVRVTAVDIDPGCLEVAKRNAKRLQAHIEFVQGDLLAPVAVNNWRQVALLCNLPYVPDSFQINPAAMREPKRAIFGGPDGLSLYRQLFDQLGSAPLKPTFVFTESMPPQHNELSQIAANAGFELKEISDFIQVFKTVSGSSGS